MKKYSEQFDVDKMYEAAVNGAHPYKCYITDDGRFEIRIYREVDALDNERNVGIFVDELYDNGSFRKHFYNLNTGFFPLNDKKKFFSQMNKILAYLDEIQLAKIQLVFDVEKVRKIEDAVGTVIETESELENVIRYIIDQYVTGYAKLDVE